MQRTVSRSIAWGAWLGLLAVALAGGGRTEEGVWGEIPIVVAAIGAAGVLVGLRRARGRTRWGDSFVPLVMLNPLLFRGGLRPEEGAMVAMGATGLMVGVMVGMRRERWVGFLAVGVLAIAAGLAAGAYVMMLLSLGLWVCASGYGRMRGTGGTAARLAERTDHGGDLAALELLRRQRDKTGGLLMMAVGEVLLMGFGLACLLEGPGAAPRAATLFDAIAGFADFPLVVGAIVILALGWGKGLGGAKPAYATGLLAVLMGMMCMLLNNFGEGRGGVGLPEPGADQTAIVLCLLYAVVTLQGGRWVRTVGPGIMMVGVVVWTVGRGAA